MEDRGDELDLLLVALGELLRAAIGVLGDTEAGQPVADLLLCRLARHAVEAGEEDELVEDLHPRVEAALLGEVPERAAGQLGRGPALPGHRPGVGAEDVEGDPHRRRLAGPVGAEEAEDLARVDGEADPVEGPDLPERLLEVGDDEAHAGGVPRACVAGRGNRASVAPTPRRRQGGAARHGGTDGPDRPCAPTPVVANAGPVIWLDIPCTPSRKPRHVPASAPPSSGPGSGATAS